MIDRGIRQSLKDRLYPEAGKDIHDLIYGALDAHLRPGTRVLNAGCGHGSPLLASYRDKISRLVGIDVELTEDRQVSNDLLVADVARIPLRDNSFDLVFCWDVVEHLAQPRTVFSEFRRVLADDGVLIARTPSILSPLMLASRLLPTSIHKKFKSRLLGSHEHDVFPTFYRSNTPGSLHRDLTSAGFQRETMTRFDRTYDQYWAFSRPTYALALLYSRALKTFPPGKAFMATIFAVYRKKPILK